MLNRSFGRSEILGLLDIGSGKISCLIVETLPSGTSGGMRLIGIGQHRSRGIKAGTITDIAEAESAIRQAVGQAERMAGLTVDEVIANVSCGRLGSLRFKAHADLDHGHVTPGDIARLDEAARAYAQRGGRSIVYMNRIAYGLDAESGIERPVGLAGNRLSADIHAVTADEGPVRNLASLVAQAYLRVRTLVPSSVASALAVTSEDERRLGVTAVDFGAGVTHLATFHNGELIDCQVLPTGGQHVTFDIARQLACPVAEAERIKTLYGTLAVAPSQEREVVSYPLAASGDGEDDMQSCTRAELGRIISGRVLRQLASVRERLEKRPSVRAAGQRVVLTGGGAELTGLAQVAAECFERPVRIGRPSPMAGMHQGMCSPALATVLGLADAVRAAPDLAHGSSRVRQPGSGYMGRMEQWLRESF